MKKLFSVFIVLLFVAIPPDGNHWHGAAPDEEFVHIGMSAQVHLGPAEWFGLVTDEEYNEATAR